MLALFGAYSAVMYFFADENKNFTVTREIDYPLEKVFPQFNNFQYFTRWNDYFSDSKKIHINYYRPYEGNGSAISFYNRDNDRQGEMFIRYENPFKVLKYQLFENENTNPTLINIKFKTISPQKTQIIWEVHTPKQPLLKRSVNFWTQDRYMENLDKSMASLKNILANKVEKDEQINRIKYDTILVEERKGGLLIGVSVSTSGKNDALFKNIVQNHNKVHNFVTTNLEKNEDEFGMPMLITHPGSFKDKEVSYFYGVPVSKRISISDNNFSFKTLNETKTYAIYFKGNYSDRISSIQKLLEKAQKDTLRNGDLEQIFIEPPTERQEVTLKISLPVYK
jgi:effector-binding domain-containing protein